MNAFAERFLARARAEKERFVGLLRNAKAEQHERFERWVRSNEDTVFGREHRFAAIKSVDDYRAAVPIRGYDELRPFVDRVVAGEANVLTADEPILFFVTTGTTGAPKRIPVTREYFTNFTANNLVYWATLAEFFPRILERDDTTVMLHLAPKPYGELTPQGVPLLNPTHVPSQGKGAFPFSRAPWFPPPAELGDAERLYFLLRSAVESDLSGLLCLHPSRLQAVVSRLASDGARIVEELERGTILGKPSLSGANAKRAKEISALLSRGELLPRHVWPHLDFVSCWAGGSFKMFLPEIREAYGAEIIPQMSASSEAGQLTMPLDREPVDGPACVRTAFFEFLPAGAKHEDRTLLLHELEAGGVYEMIVTTCSGLYRYAGGDRFEVKGFVHGVPRLEFVGRAGVVDMTGEKVSEEHVGAAIEHGLATCALRAVNATCCPVLAKPSHYVFVFEPADEWSPEVTAKLEAAIDRELIRLNPRYQLKRDFGDLGAAVVRIAARGAFARHREARIASGVAGGSLKDKLLWTDSSVLSTLGIR